MIDHSDLQATVAAYLLGACEAEESEQVRHHLESCASCRELALRLRWPVDHLGLAAPEVEPPARLKTRVLAAAQVSPQRRAVEPPSSAPVLRLPRARQDAWWQTLRRPSTAGIAALAAAVLALGVWDVALSQQVTHLQASQGVEARYRLTGKGPMVGAQATVVDLRSDGLTVLDFKNMPSLQAGKVYKLWLIDAAGTPAPSKVFEPNADGSATVVITTDLSGVKTLAVTVEQGPQGPPTPSQDPQMTGRVA